MKKLFRFLPRQGLIFIAIGAALITSGCGQKKEDVPSTFPEFTVLEGNCPQRSDEISGTCKFLFKQQSKTARSVQFKAFLNQPSSRATFIMNASTPELKDGVQITLTRTSEAKTAASIRIGTRDFSVNPAQTVFWVPNSLELVFDFHPQPSLPPKIYFWRTGYTYTAIAADVNSEYAQHLSAPLFGDPGSGEYSGVSLIDASLARDPYKVDTPKVTN